MYSYTDKIISALNKRFIRYFRKLRILKFDEMNILPSVISVYQKADSNAKNGYLDIAQYAYMRALDVAKKYGFEPKRKRDIGRDWVLDFLEETDFVTMYDYDNEWERKRQRLSEALVSTNKPMQEIDKALRLIALQVSHYADKATAEATLQAFKDAGVKKVKWITERDNRVCKSCAPLDGKVFSINKAPRIPQHYHCRCVLVPYN